MNRTIHEIVIRDEGADRQKCCLRSRIDDPRVHPHEERTFVYQDAQMSFTASDELIQLMQCNDAALVRSIGESWLQERDYES